MSTAVSRISPRRLARALLSAGLWLCLAAPAAARADEAKKIPFVTYSPEMRAFEHQLPHGTPFRIEIERSGVDAEFDSVVATYWEAGAGGCASPSEAKVATGTAGAVSNGKRKYYIQIAPLRYSTGYCFQFSFRRPFSENDRTAIETAIGASLGATTWRGVYGAEEIRQQLAQRLDAYKSILVEPIQPGERAVKLVDVIMKRFSGPAARKLFEYDKMYDARVSYHNEEGALREQIQELVGLGASKHDPGLFGAPPPEALNRFDQSFDVVAKEAKALKLDAALTPQEKERRHREEPTAPTQEENQLRRRLEELRDRADDVRNTLCGSSRGPAATFCAQAVPAVRNAADAAIKDFDERKSAGADYGALRAKVVVQIKQHVAALRVTDAAGPLTTTSITYSERSRLYVSADVGIAVPIFIGGGADLAPFLGVNVYFTGVDKDIPLSLDDSFAKRFSLVGGITLGSIRDHKNTVEGIVGGNGLLAGAGLRLTDYLRLGGGVVFVRQRDANPVATTTKHVRVTPYAAVSIDVDVAGVVADSVKKFQ